MSQKILFVCLGNICRSPMAEALLKHKIAQKLPKSEVSVDSAGTGDWHIGSDPDPRTIRTCRENDVIIEHKAQQINAAHFYEFNYIITMDDNNYKDVSALMPEDSKAEIIKMTSYYKGGDYKIVPDPYTGTMSDFRRLYKMLDGCIDRFIDEKLINNS